MVIEGAIQPDTLPVDDELRLRKASEADAEVGLPWYQNEKIVRFSEGPKAKPFDIEAVRTMYSHLEYTGELYFIETLEHDTWRPIRDIALFDGELVITVGEEVLWGRGIGRRCLRAMIERGEDIDLVTLKAKIYKYNERSRRLFESSGFVKTSEDEVQNFFIRTSTAEAP